MIIFPAIDLKNGQCVRLRQGLEHEVTVFSSDPVAMAGHFAAQGAQWLHVIDLDGAFQGRPVNQELIRRICGAVEIPVQLGGGIRDCGTAAAYFECGVTRLIIGTIAIEQPQLFHALCQEFPGRIGVSLDVRDGLVRTRGWVGESSLTVKDILPRLQDMGSAFFIYTDISRDGMQSGADEQGLLKILALAEVPVLVAGGISCLRDIQSLFPLAARGLQGVISGKAVYTGSLNLAEAQSWINEQMAKSR